MPKILAFFFLTLLISSCQQEAPDSTTADAGDVELQNRIKQLELDNALKDSVINESLSFFNEIKENLAAIGIRKDQIRKLSENPEISNDDKQWILEEIRQINFLREENASKVKQMQSQMKVSNLKIEQLEIMIESLQKDIQWKDEQINLLQTELDNLDKEYSAIFDAYQQQAMKVDQLTNEINKVFYAYGSEQELLENKVIEKKNGFIGFGKKTELKSNFNDDYFTQKDITKFKTLMLDGETPRLITHHPSGSYYLEVMGGRTKLVITDASEFWKLSKYLVIVVD
jgi:uncharacterized protein YoxC